MRVYELINKLLLIPNQNIEVYIDETKPIDGIEIIDRKCYLKNECKPEEVIELYCEEGAY